MNDIVFPTSPSSVQLDGLSDCRPQGEIAESRENDINPHPSGPPSFFIPYVDYAVPRVLVESNHHLPNFRLKAGGGEKDLLHATYRR
jgi:hypothetical protein